MSDATADRSEYGDINPWLIAILVAIATFMEVLDTTIANVALRYISGGLAVSSDEASWVVTTYLVANSVVLAASGWIAEMFGRKNFFLVCIGLFSISSLLCGFAWSLQALLLFRVMQGLAGGGMTPVAQSILAAPFRRPGAADSRQQRERRPQLASEMMHPIGTLHPPAPQPRPPRSIDCRRASEADRPMYVCYRGGVF
jgi:MFS family permease